MQERYWYFYFAQNSSKKLFEFDLGRMNQACSYGKISLNVEIYQYWERFGILGLSGFRRKENQRGLNRVVYHREKALDWDLESKNKVSGYWVLWVGISEKRQKAAFSNYQNSSASNEINAFKTYITSATDDLSMETLMKEIMPVVTEKKVFVPLDESKLMADFRLFGSSEF